MNGFRVAAVFSNHMVLQRNKKIVVFGEGPENEMVTVTMNEHTYEDRIYNGKWMVQIPPMAAGGPYEMKVQCGENEKVFSDIAIGEVWLAGGQSNMEYELQDCLGGKEMLKGDENPNVRFYYTPKNGYMDERHQKDEDNSSWAVFSEENAKHWSAVGYIFGKKLAKDLDVTVGIIGCNWGGSSASCWVSRESLIEDQELATYVEEYEDGMKGKTLEQQRKEYDTYVAYHEVWEEKSKKLYEENPDMLWEEVVAQCGECQWPGPINHYNPYRPSGMYECMLQRITPYSLRGFLYYQGESDDHKPQMYQKLFTRLIRQWREDWQEYQLPFLFVQLPMHRYIQDPDYKNWCVIRQAQRNVYETVKNTGMAVAIDCGEFNQIHPKNKLPVGERLELQALYQVYHWIPDTMAFGPLYETSYVRGEQMELVFRYADDGFVIHEPVREFEIAGSDEIYYEAEVHIEENRIYVSSKQVKEPRYVRYCWTNYGPVNIYGKNGIPLAPFTSKLG